MAEGNKRLCQVAISVQYHKKRPLQGQLRFTQEQEGRNGAESSSAHPSPVEDANGDPEGLVLGPRAAVAVGQSLPRGQDVRSLFLRGLPKPCRRDAQDRVLHHLIAVEAVQAAERSRRHAVANA